MAAASILRVTDSSEGGLENLPRTALSSGVRDVVIEGAVDMNVPVLSAKRSHDRCRINLWRSQETVVVGYALTSLESVTRKMLASAIAHEYPGLTINLERTQLATPQVGGGWVLQPFMPRVLDYLGSSIELDLSPIEGQAYYLSDTPPTLLRPRQGELDMKVIERLVKELSWRLPIGLQGALTDFWGEYVESGIRPPLASRRNAPGTSSLGTLQSVAPL